MNTTVRYSATIPSGINPLGRKGMVSTPHYLASQAGLDALRRGGTAVDAAIAASAVLCVVYPHMCGLGGDSFWLIYDAARGELKALNASGRAAASASPEFYAVRGFKAVPARGYMAACTVPGAVSGWDEAFKLSKTSMGSPLSWAELLDPARGYAEDGFPVGHSLAHWLAVDTSGQGAGRGLHQFPAFLDVFCKENGRPYTLGETLRQPDLADSLARLAQHGADEFYHGSIARAIADSMMLHSGLLTVGDMDDHQADWAEPLRVPYRDLTACSAPPNSQGMAALEILNICNNLDLAALGEGSADYYQAMVEAVRLAFQDRDRWLSDPAFGDIPLDRLLSPEYGREQAKRIRLEQSSGPLPPLAPGGGRGRHRGFHAPEHLSRIRLGHGGHGHRHSVAEPGLRLLAGPGARQLPGTGQAHHAHPDPGHAAQGRQAPAGLRQHGRRGPAPDSGGPDHPHCGFRPGPAGRGQCPALASGPELGRARQRPQAGRPRSRKRGRGTAPSRPARAHGLSLIHI